MLCIPLLKSMQLYVFLPINPVTSEAQKRLIQLTHQCSGRTRNCTSGFRDSVLVLWGFGQQKLIRKGNLEEDTFLWYLSLMF